MTSPHSAARRAAVQPTRAIEGGRITVVGSGFPVASSPLPAVRVGGRPARVVCASSTMLDITVPQGAAGEAGGRAAVQIDVPGGDPVLAEVNVAATIATGLHQVDSPAFDAAGNLYLSFSGTRGQEVPVSIFRVRPNGARETFSSGIVNATSMAVGPDGRLYVSSRFEGTVYRVDDGGSAEAFAADLGVACGLAFGADGTLFVGDRTGTIFKVDHAGHAAAFATLPPSVAAFHLAMGRDGALFVTGPTLSAYDSVYRIDRSGAVTTYGSTFGRPQGLAFHPDGSLLVVEALAGASGVYRLRDDGAPELMVAAPGLVGVALDPISGELVVCSNDTAYRLG